MQKTNETFLREALYDAIYAATFSPEKEYGIFLMKTDSPTTTVAKISVLR